MAKALDPRVERFLRIHAVDVRQEVESDVADDRDLTPAERWRILERLSPSAEWLVEANPPELVASLLEWRDPPHPTYREIVARLRRGQ
jgi:hypothetical protein